MNKGIVISMLCTNPSCTFSEQKLKIKQAFTIAATSGRCVFNMPKCCPKCKSGIELLSFVSGSVEITEDIKNE